MATDYDQKDPSVTAEEVRKVVARIQTGVLTIVMALICGLSLFLMTAWLLIRSGENVGAHLQLLGNYFPGYSVTWFGSIVGLFYGLLVGGILGWSIATIYNKVVSIRQRPKTRPGVNCAL
jgi:hypothetical protein